MTEKRPLPEADEARDRRANERLVRWVAALVGFLTVSAVLLMLLLRLNSRG